MTAQRTHATRPVADLLRFSCTLCGGCCEGVRVPIYNEEQAELAASAGRDLGIADPVVGDDNQALRMVDGHCVFLGDNKKCRIHSELSPDRKPIPCRQFPLIALAADEDVRIGIDPAAYGAYGSWKAGQVLEDTAVVATRTPSAQADLELALVRMCEDEQASIAGLLAVLTREPADRGELPSGFASRWAERLSTVDLNAFLALDGPGPVLKRSLAPMARASRAWTDGPPSWRPLDPDVEAWAIEATRRVLWLRLQANIPNVSVAAMFLLGGAVAAAWTNPAPDAFHAMHTAWIRALRFDLFWKTLAGDTATLVWLGTGQRP